MCVPVCMRCWHGNCQQKSWKTNITQKYMGRKMKTSHATLCSDCFYRNRWTKRGLFDLQWRKENTRNPQAMSLQPHVTKQPHLVGKLATLQGTHQSKQTPTKLKRIDRSPPRVSTGDSFCSSSEKEQCVEVNKALPGASVFQAPGHVCL